MLKKGRFIMKKPKTKLPRFKSEAEEQAFWSTHDSTDFVDWTSAHSVILPKLKPTTQAISIRLPVFLIETLKQLAHKRDVPYQSLLKILLEEAVSKESGKLPRKYCQE